MLICVYFKLEIVIILVCMEHVNSLPAHPKNYDTWETVKQKGCHLLILASYKEASLINPAASLINRGPVIQLLTGHVL
jgi:hypothetical protein